VTFRTRLVILVALTVIGTVGAVTWVVATATNRAFETLDNQRTQALIGQFRREFARRGQEVVRTAEGIAGLESILRMAVRLERGSPDLSRYLNEAESLAAAHGVGFLELVAHDGAIVSSAQWPARFGYKEDWLLETADWNRQGAFLKREELPNEAALALAAVRSVSARDKNVYVVAGYRLDRDFLGSLVLPAGMRVLLYPNLDREFNSSALIDATGPIPEAGRLAPLIERVRRERRELAETISWPSGAETFQAIPLDGRGEELLGVLIVGRSRKELAALVRNIQSTGAVAGGAGILLGILLSYWVSARVTRPVERLAEGARQVASGDWETRVEVRSEDEIGELAEAFNAMTRQLLEQRDRLVQTERVAAWRELARRLAHELKNPLFPLQITVENLQRVRSQAPEQFDEVFRESTETLLAELSNLKTIIGRFSEFATMPPPRFEEVSLNETVRRSARLFEAQLRSGKSPPVSLDLNLADEAGVVQADPEQLNRALQNLMLNAIDAMPSSGTLTIRTSRTESSVVLEVSDTGEGLTPEECERLFTPYYTTRQHGTGLGLAIVQSVVSDHKGRITVEGERGKGATFRIGLPASPGNIQ